VSSHADFSEFSGRRVALVGAGQSALETAAILAESGAETVLLVRRPALQWDRAPRPDTKISHWLQPESGIGAGWHKQILESRADLVRYLPRQTRAYLLRRVLGPSGASWLRDRFEQQDIDVRVATRVTLAEANGTGLRLSLDTAGRDETIHVDHVLAA